MKKLRSAAAVALILIFSVLFAVGCTRVSLVTYKVKFMVEGEQYYVTNTAGNAVVAMPASPTKEGYDFGGWYFDEDFGAEFTADSLKNRLLTADLTVYAKFTEKPLTGTQLKLSGFTSATEHGITVFSGEAEESLLNFQSIVRTASGAEWSVHYDVEGTAEIKTKITMLSPGENVFFITVRNGGSMTTYEVKVTLKQN